MLCGLLTIGGKLQRMSDDGSRALPPQCNGWKQTETGLEIEWDSEDSIKQIKHCVDFLLHGCKYKSSSAMVPQYTENGTYTLYCLEDSLSQSLSFKLCPGIEKLLAL